MKITFARFMLPYKYQSYGHERIMQIAQDADHPLRKEFQQCIIIHQ